MKALHTERIQSHWQRLSLDSHLFLSSLSFMLLLSLPCFLSLLSSVLFHSVIAFGYTPVSLKTSIWVHKGPFLNKTIALHDIYCCKCWPFTNISGRQIKRRSRLVHHCQKSYKWQQWNLRATWDFPHQMRDMNWIHL